MPQNRERVYIAGYLRERGRREIFPIERASEKDYGNEYTTTVPTSGLVCTLSANGGGQGGKTGLYAIKVKNCTKQGYQEARPGDGIDLSYPESKTRRGRVGDQIFNTLTTQKNAGTLDWDGTEYRIRRLTPKECWRLQGFPDWAYEKAKATGLSDTQLYKQAGNAVTVSVIQAIGERLNGELKDDED